MSPKPTTLNDWVLKIAEENYIIYYIEIGRIPNGIKTFLNLIDNDFSRNNMSLFKIKGRLLNA